MCASGGLQKWIRLWRKAPICYIYITFVKMFFFNSKMDVPAQTPSERNSKIWGFQKQYNYSALSNYTFANSNFASRNPSFLQKNSMEKCIGATGQGKQRKNSMTKNHFIAKTRPTYGTCRKISHKRSPKGPWTLWAQKWSICKQSLKRKQPKKNYFFFRGGIEKNRSTI